MEGSTKSAYESTELLPEVKDASQRNRNLWLHSSLQAPHSTHVEKENYNEFERKPTRRTSYSKSEVKLTSD